MSARGRATHSMGSGSARRRNRVHAAVAAALVLFGGALGSATREARAAPEEPAVGAKPARADTTRHGDLLRRLQERDRAFFGDELLRFDEAFVDSSRARYDSLGLQAARAEHPNAPHRIDLDFDPALPLWAFNRVEGWVAGAGARLTLRGPRTASLVARGARAFASRSWRHASELTLDVAGDGEEGALFSMPGEDRVDAESVRELGRGGPPQPGARFGATLFATWEDRVVPFGGNRPFGNGVRAFVGAEDEQHYLRQRGGAAGVRAFVLDHGVRLALAYTAHRETPQATRDPFALGGDLDAPNAPAAPGIDRAVQARLQWRTRRGRLGVVALHRVAGGALGGDFTYQRFAFAAEAHDYVLGRQELLARVTYTRAGGRPPLQRLADAGGLNSVRGFDARTRTGRAAWTLRLEHWWPYDVLGATRIPGLRRARLQFVPWVDAAWVDTGDGGVWVHAFGLGLQRFLGALGPASNLRLDVAFPAGPLRREDVHLSLRFAPGLL